MSERKKYTGDNPILKWFAAIRPQLWDAPEFEQLSFILSHAVSRPMGEMVHVSQVCDAMAELCPDNREFWLRVDATHIDHLVKAMTAMFTEEYGCETDE